MAMGNKEKPILFPASKVLGYGGKNSLYLKNSTTTKNESLSKKNWP